MQLFLLHFLIWGIFLLCAPEWLPYQWPSSQNAEKNLMCSHILRIISFWTIPHFIPAVSWWNWFASQCRCSDSFFDLSSHLQESFLFYLCLNLWMLWPVLKFWNRTRTISVDTEIKISFKDEVGQWDSMRALLSIFSYCIWNKHLPHLWQGRIWHCKFVERKNCCFLLFSWTKSVHGLLKQLKLCLLPPVGQKYLTWIY